MARSNKCPLCGTRTTAPQCCGVVFAWRQRWRMTKARVQRVHAVAMGRKGLDEEAYRLRVQAVGAQSSKQFTREQFNAFMRGLAKLPDVRRARGGERRRAA